MGADKSMNAILGPATPSVVGPYNYTNITTLATTTVKTGAGILHLIQVNNPNAAAATITVYDNTAGSGTKIATITTVASATAVPVPLVFDVVFSTGLTIVTATTALDITVSWK
jgi:hypothetical protein